MQKMPHARKSGLIVKEADGEILIYDEHNSRAHCLNATAAKVWQHCDGRSTIAEVCMSLSSDLEAPVDENIVWYAIDQFSRDNLLQEKTLIPAGLITNMNRRQMVRTLGLAAVIALPLVTTIVAPDAAHAATLKAPGAPCCAGAECTSTICNGVGAGPPPCTPPGTCF